MNNPLALVPVMLSMLQKNANPQQMLYQMAQQNPALRQAMQMVNGRTPGQIRDMAYQMAAQQGIDLNQLASQLGIQLPR